MNYCTYNDVGVLLQLTYSTTSKPTQDQITDIITQCTNEIDSILFSVGVIQQPSDANSLGMLRKYCSMGAAGLVDMTYPGNTATISAIRAKWLYDEYKLFLEKLKTSPEIIIAGSISTSNYISNNVLDGSLTEDENNSMYVCEEFDY